MRLFLDANVLFSAALSPGGVGHALVALGRKGACTLVTSAYAAAEAERNVRVKASEALGRFAVVMANVTRVPEASPGLVADEGSELPAKDRPILAAAVACGADLLVTGDRRRFGSLFGVSVGRTAVASPRVALGVLLESIGTQRVAPRDGPSAP